jgi:D-aspartate ligase
MGDCAVVTGTDVASEFLAAERATLPESVRTFEATGQVHRALMNKWSAYEIADRAGVRRPWSHSASTPADLESAVKAASYPCVLKPVLSHLWRRQFGDDRVLLMRTPAELEAGGSRALATGLEIVVSDYIPGGDDAVEEAILVRAKDGSYPVAFGCRKLRQHPTGFGAASLCVSAPIPQSMELARRLLDEAGYVGVAGIETKRHAESGDYYFLEANVRIPTQWGLGDAAGADASWRLYATLAGLELGAQAPPRHGVKLVFPQLELHAAYRTLRGGPGPGLLRRLAGWRGAKDLGVFDPRDPGPGLALARDVIARRVAQLPGRRRRR